MLKVNDIRVTLAEQYSTQNFVIDKTGAKTVEIVNASFLADENSIFGAVNEDYVQRELDWYKSESLYVKDIPGGPPKIWAQVACRDGMINSNYGWCIYSNENLNQYDRVREELSKNPDSRRGIMIYTRPTMWLDYNENGRSDFMCTNAVQYILRDNKLNAVVQMRSNDAWAGYRNDYAWQLHVLKELTKDLGVEIGNIHWNVGSLHVYAAQFYLLDYYLKTGNIHITKDEWMKLEGLK